MSIILFQNVGGIPRPVDGSKGSVQVFQDVAYHGATGSVELFQEVLVGVALGEVPLSIVSYGAALGIVDVNYQDAALGGVNVVHPLHSFGDTVKLMALNCQADVTGLYAVDVAVDTEPIVSKPKLQDGTVSWVGGGNSGGANVKKLWTRTKNNLVVSVCPETDSVIVTTIEGRPIYNYRGQAGDFFNAIAIAADEQYLFVLEFVGTGTPDDTIVYEGFDDKFIVVQRYLDDGSLVQYELVSFGAKGGVSLVEETHTCLGLVDVNLGSPYAVGLIDLAAFDFAQGQLSVSQDFFVDGLCELDDLSVVVGGVQLSQESTYDFVFGVVEVGTTNAVQGEVLVVGSDTYCLGGCSFTSAYLSFSSQSLSDVSNKHDSMFAGMSYSWGLVEHGVDDQGRVVVRRSGQFRNRVFKDEFPTLPGGPFDGDPVSDYRRYNSTALEDVNRCFDFKERGGKCLNLRLFVIDGLLIVASADPFGRLLEYNAGTGDYDSVGTWTMSNWVTTVDRAVPPTGGPRRSRGSVLQSYDVATKHPTIDVSRRFPATGLWGLDCDLERVVFTELVTPDDTPDLENLTVDLVSYDYDGQVLVELDGLVNPIAALRSPPAVGFFVDTHRMAGGLNIPETSVQLTDAGIVSWAYGDITASTVEDFVYSGGLILVPSWGLVRRVQVQDVLVNKPLIATVVRYPLYALGQVEVIGTLQSIAQGAVEAYAALMDYTQAHVEFFDDWFVLGGLDTESGGNVALGTALVAHTGYRVEEIMVVNSGCVSYDGRVWSEFDLEYWAETFIELPNVFRGAASVPHYPCGTHFWRAGSRLKEWPSNFYDREADGWIVETPRVEPLYSDTVPPLPAYYEVDNDLGVLFGLAVIEDNQLQDELVYSDQVLAEIQATSSQIMAQVRPYGMLVKSTAVNRSYDLVVPLPNKVIDGVGNESFFNYRHFGVDKLRQRLYVIRVNGRRDPVATNTVVKGHWYEIFSSGSGNTYDTWCTGDVRQEGLQVALEEFVYQTEHYAGLSIYYKKSWPYSKYLDLPLEDTNDYTVRDVLEYDYDFNLVGVLKTIRGLAPEDVVMHMYQQNGVWYILTQSLREDAEGVVAANMSRYPGDPGLNIDKVVGDYTYAHSKIYVLEGSLNIGTATLFYEFPYASAAYDNIVIQEVTDNHIWLNWDGVSRDWPVYLDGMSIDLGTKVLRVCTGLHALKYNYITEKWEAYFRELDLEGVDPHVISKPRVKGEVYEASEKTYVYKAAVKIVHPLCFNELLVVRDATTLDLLRTEPAQQAVFVNYTEHEKFSNMRGSYPAVSRVFQVRYEDYALGSVDVITELGVDVGLEAELWFDKATGGSVVVEVD